MNTGASRNESGAGEAERASVLHVDDSGQKCLGLLPRGNPVTRVDSLGYDCPFSHPTMVLLLLPPLPLHYTSVMGLELQRGR